MNVIKHLYNKTFPTKKKIMFEFCQSGNQKIYHRPQQKGVV